MLRKFVAFALRAGAVVALLLFALWGSLALYFRAPFGEGARIAAGCVFALAMLAAAFLIARRKWKRALAPLALAPVVLVWWQTLVPSNDRDWALDVSRPAITKVMGDKLTVENVRNFEWRTETDFTPRWETRTYDLSKLNEVDLFASYWAGEDIAHILVGFGFSDNQRLVWSIELRRTKTQTYSALASFFKQSELVFLAADERDIIRLRTNVRGENVRMFPLRLKPQVARRLLLEYAEMANNYALNPRWYNTITANCTTMVFRIARALNPLAPFDWRVLLSGHFPELVYDHGGIDNSIPFAQWRQKAQIDKAAQAADQLDSVAFSKAIRTQFATR
jgi:hypothetical protein